MTTPDPFAFVQQALGVEVHWLQPPGWREGYYLDGPHPEWLGDNLAAAIAEARRRLEAAGMGAPGTGAVNWRDLARRARESLPLVGTLLDHYAHGGPQAPSVATSPDPIEDDEDDLP